MSSQIIIRPVYLQEKAAAMAYLHTSIHVSIQFCAVHRSLSGAVTTNNSIGAVTVELSEC